MQRRGVFMTSEVLALADLSLTFGSNSVARGFFAALTFHPTISFWVGSGQRNELSKGV